jgi:hypothetical protein
MNKELRDMLLVYAGVCVGVVLFLGLLGLTVVGIMWVAKAAGVA